MDACGGFCARLSSDSRDRRLALSFRQFPAVGTHYRLAGTQPRTLRFIPRAREYRIRRMNKRDLTPKEMLAICVFTIAGVGLSITFPRIVIPPILAVIAGAFIVPVARAIGRRGDPRFAKRPPDAP